MDVAAVGKRFPTSARSPDGPARRLDCAFDGPHAPRERHVRPVHALLGAKAALRECVPQLPLSSPSASGGADGASHRIFDSGHMPTVSSVSSNRAWTRIRRHAARGAVEPRGRRARPRNAPVRCRRSLAIGRPLLKRAAWARRAGEIAARVASSGHSAKNTRCRSGSASERRSSTHTRWTGARLERQRHRLPAHGLAAASKDAPRGRRRGRAAQAKCTVPRACRPCRRRGLRCR